MQRLGILERRLPITPWDGQPLTQFLHNPLLAEPEAYLCYRRHRRENNPEFFFSPELRPQFAPLLSIWDANEASNKASPVFDSERIKEGVLRYFGHILAQTGFPPNWFTNPFTGQQASTSRHWSQISDFDNGDIKVIWEPNRFGFVYSLVRAYWRTGSEQYAELFWQMVESWRAHNQPQQGPNWKCGQEISFRVMAWCFGLYGFLDSQQTTAERVSNLAQMIAVSGQRIEANLGYALSQHNNHGISEGMGLWTIGVLFPEFSLAARWRERGKQVLESLGRELIYEDGSFAQHSVNYHRLMLHDYLWSLRLGDLYGLPFSPELKERVGKAGDFLFQIQDTESGHLPCYGQNDGALILALSNCDYQDFRPVIQTAYYLATGKRCYPAGPWDEELLWLFGQEALTAPVEPPSKADLRAEIGGYYTLRSSNGFLFTRCASFKHRPGQADMLHVDLWWRGKNIVLDSGTYSYNAPPPWDNSLAHTAYHNTVTVDDLDQMARVGKFLWLPWVRGQVRCYQKSAGEPAGGQLAYWEGEHNGYHRLKPSVSHRRGILRLGADHWLIFDALRSRGLHRYRLHWLFPDLPYEWDAEAKRLVLQTVAGFYSVLISSLPDKDNGIYSLVRADEHSPRGWRSPYYNHREPALSVDLVENAHDLTFWTLFGPETCVVSIETVSHKENTLHIKNQSWHAEVKFQVKDADPIITFASLVDGGEVNRVDKVEISL